VEVEMPDDWNDHAGWNRYYRHRIEQRDWQSSLFDYFFQRDGPELRAAGCQRVWVPGCGITSAPSRLAHMGFEVVATDASSVAVRFQQQAKYSSRNPQYPAAP
jgi:2-polyprenyl-3-methyl-5-hydroxy-6-metoxy-1,4-benzoquinol methylase